MFRHLENGLFVRFVEAFGVGEDEVGNIVTTVAVGNFAGAVEDDVESFGVDAHFKVRGVAGEMVQEVIDFIH